eukprot:jgi/Ulvmu1/3429/UM016_0048.1
MADRTVPTRTALLCKRAYATDWHKTAEANATTYALVPPTSTPLSSMIHLQPAAPAKSSKASQRRFKPPYLKLPRQMARSPSKAALPPSLTF